MKIYPVVIALLLCFCISDVQAQSAKPAKKKKQAINEFDGAGKPHGWWHSQKEPRMGEPGFQEFGIYYHGRKMGLWYKMDDAGELLAVEGYKNDAKDGEVKYFDRGRLMAVGHYRGLNPDQPTDTIMVEHPITGVQELRSVSTDKGSLRHGLWRYYDPETGRLTREEEYQVDELIYTREFKMSHADSVYYSERAARLPHNKTEKVKPPKGRKPISYIDY